MVQITNGNKVIALVVVLVVIDYIAVGLRFVARNMRRQKWGADDWLATLVLLPITALATLLVYACATKALGEKTQFDGDNNPIATDKFILGATLGFAFQCLESPTLALLKGSVLLCYRRIFDTPKFKIINSVLLGLLVPWTIMAFCCNLFNCGTHIDANYSRDFDYTYKYCANLKIPLTLYVVTDVIFDLAIFMQPIPMILRLQMPKTVKITIAATFFLGSLTLVFAILRMSIFLTSFFGSIQSSWNLFDDELQFYTIINTFTFLEISLGCLAACLPTLRPVAGKVIPSLNRMFAPRSEKRTGDSDPYTPAHSQGPRPREARFGFGKKDQYNIEATSVSSVSRLREGKHPWETLGGDDIELQSHAK